MEFYSAMKKNEILSFSSKWWNLRTSFWVELAWPRKPKIVCSPSYVDIRSRVYKGTGLWSHDKARAHEGGMRISKTPKKTR
jgi:hypothetical protein